MAIRVIRDRGLRPASTLEGREIASPARRGGAFAIDMVLLVIPSIAAGLLGAWLALSIRQPAALEAMIDLITGGANDPAVAATRLKDLLPLMVEYRMPGTPVEAIAAYQAGDLDRAFERFVGYFQIPASFGTALFDLWRDPNRRLPHDRLVGTVVLRGCGAPVTEDDESDAETQAEDRNG